MSENFRPDLKHLKIPVGDKICLDKETNAYVNKYISRYLEDFQVEGIKFLYKIFKNKKGCSDEMGLGKTIQVISFLAAVLEKQGIEEDLNATRPECVRKELGIDTNKKVRPFLISCPATIIGNWEDELNRWGYFSVGLFHDASSRATSIHKLENNRYDVLLTTHETLRDHVDSLSKFKWAAIIVDEFHKLKNTESQISKAYYKFKRTKTRIGLSGTILQNSVMELWSLLDWVNPNCLGDEKQFKREFYFPILAGQRQNASQTDLLNKVLVTKEFNSRTEEWILRRSKSIIAHKLTKKTDQLVYCKLSEFQIGLFKRLLNSSEFNSMKKQETLMFVGFFMKVANHPALYLEGFNENTINKYLLNIFPNIFKQKEKFYLNENCGKIQVLDEMLKVFYERKDKVLLFSYSVKMLNILQRFIQEKHYKFVRLDGETKNSERQKLVNSFNENQEIFIFLISTKAGGIGLNITGANVVIIFDPNWNPSHDLQAQDRAYRMGQRRDVSVFRLISSGCIEENIYLRQIYKMHLSKECIENKAAMRIFNLSKDNKQGEIFGKKNLFSINDNEDIVLTREIYKRYTNIEHGIAGVKSLTGSTFIKEIDSDMSCSKIYIMDPDELDNILSLPDQNSNESIRNVFKNSNVLHVHSNNDLTKTSKIENHIRENITIAGQPNAFNCVHPDLNTLDYFEMNYVDLELTKNLKGAKQQTFHVNDSCTVIYGQVPNEIMKEQFEKMAEMLKTDTISLSQLIAAMTKEERFGKLKQFYLKQYPQTQAFYESFSNKKRKVDNRLEQVEELLIEKEENESKRLKVKTEEIKEEKKSDYYEIYETFENVLDLLPDSPKPNYLDEDEARAEKILEIFKNTGNFENISLTTNSPKKQFNSPWSQRSVRMVNRPIEILNEQVETNFNDNNVDSSISVHSNKVVELVESKNKFNTSLSQLNKNQVIESEFKSNPMSYLDKLLSP